MNPHFQRQESADWLMPTKVYARLDHVEVADPHNQTILLAFDTVDAQWLADRARFDERFDMDNADNAVVALAARPLSPSARGQGQSPFESARLFRIEIEHQPGARLFGPHQPSFFDTGQVGDGSAELEAAWFILELNHDGTTPAQVYPALFASPQGALVKGTMPSPQQGKALSAIFSLASLPSITTFDLEKKLSVAVADLLAVYDVGQGNSNALLKSASPHAWPTLYYDLGAGVYRNQHTTPSNLVFCFSVKPPIVLSHWDADHWAGAYATSVGGAYPARLQNWYAPIQTIGPVHTAFAHDVIAAGGTMSTYSPVGGAIGTSTLTASRVLRFMLGTGSDRNNTGIVVSIEDNSSTPKRSWLLTGDCDYAHFITPLNPNPPVGLVAPHHGATLASGTQAPAPVLLQDGYRRLVYSFGAGNRHGRTQHPTAAGMQLHSLLPGWNHNSWNPTTPGLCVAGGDVLATEMHGMGGTPGTQLGGCLIGWDSASQSVSAPCMPRSCTTSPIQA
jgi:hypothetical protein